MVSASLGFLKQKSGRDMERDLLRYTGGEMHRAMRIYGLRVPSRPNEP